MGIKLTNNAFATLAAGINSSATSITLTTGQGARFPTLAGGDYFYATLVDTSNNLEIVKCTARSTDVLTVVRGQESTTARAYVTGDRIEIRITAQTFIDALTEIPSQTGNAGKYLTTDGTSVSWGTVTAPTPAAVSDQANSSTGYFDLPAGTQAQRPGSPGTGMMRHNTSNDTVEIYHNLGDGVDGFYSFGGRVLIARQLRSDAWNTTDVVWGFNGPRYIGYEVEVILTDANTNQSRLYMQVHDYVGVQTGGIYGYSDSWSAGNDGGDIAGTNYNSATPAYGSQIPISNWNSVDAGYWSQSNGESHQCAKVKFYASLPSGFTSNRWNFTGEYVHDSASYGVTGGVFRGQVNLSNTATATNGATYYPITGIRVGFLDGYTSRAAGSPGISSIITVYGITGLEERNIT
jgi:hypothetical protein